MCHKEKYLFQDIPKCICIEVLCFMIVCCHYTYYEGRETKIYNYISVLVSNCCYFDNDTDSWKKSSSKNHGNTDTIFCY